MKDISLFDFIDELEPEDIQKEMVAADLSMLLVHSDCSRSQLASVLEYKKSRISRILSGDENLTLKTLTKVANALGYTFDVVFYNNDYPKPNQPWHIDRLDKYINIEPMHTEPYIELKFQNSKDVFNDFMQGNDADTYISVNKNFDVNKIESLQTSKNIINSNNSFYLDVLPSSDNSFFLNLEKKDKERWLTI